MLRTFAPFTAAFAIIAVAAACGTTTVVEVPPAGDAGPPANSLESLVTIDSITINQGAKITLVDQGAVVAPKAFVVPSRPALVRVHATNASKTLKLSPLAELTIHQPNQADIVLTDGPRALGHFDEGNLDTTFHFDLTADQISKDATLSVNIRDPKGIDATHVTLPADGDDPISMNVGSLIPKLKVTLAPIIYAADQSNRQPVLDAATVEGYRLALYKMYPVSEVDITIRAPFTWTLNVDPNGDGWNELLAAVMKTRKDDNVPDDVYYVGVFEPAPSEGVYCQKGCVLGVAPATFGSETAADKIDLRAAMIVGYPSPQVGGTLAQELAHAMQRLHAPCGNPQQLDVKYPYDDANIGVWGWDVVDKKLIDPDDVSDFMSYCSPVWVSDYTFNGIYKQMVDVEATKTTPTPTAQWQSYHVGNLGTVPGAMIDVRTTVTPKTYVLEDASHNVITTVKGVFSDTAAIGGGILVTPTTLPDSQMKRVRFTRVLP